MGRGRARKKRSWGARSGGALVSGQHHRSIPHHLIHLWGPIFACLIVYNTRPQVESVIRYAMFPPSRLRKHTIHMHRLAWHSMFSDGVHICNLSFFLDVICGSSSLESTNIAWENIAARTLMWSVRSCVQFKSLPKYSAGKPFLGTQACFFHLKPYSFQTYFSLQNC
jgi:hypothetical protein